MNADDWSARALAVTFQNVICFFVIRVLTLGNKKRSVLRNILDQDQSGELHYNLTIRRYFENGCCVFGLGKAAN